MGGAQSSERASAVGFDTLQVIACGKRTDMGECVLINTMPSSRQSCLIANTIAVENEEETINRIIEHKKQTQWCVIVYGCNHADETVEKKCRQMKTMGFTRLYRYNGGIFEWLLLQEVYGNDSFPTTSRHIDILEFKPSTSNENEILAFTNLQRSRAAITRH